MVHGFRRGFVESIRGIVWTSVEIMTHTPQIFIMGLAVDGDNSPEDSPKSKQVVFTPKLG